MFEILKPVIFASELSTGVPGPSRPFWRISKNHFHIKNLCMSVRHVERSKVVSITFDRPTWSYFLQKAQNILLLVERSKVDSVNFRPPYIEMIFPETWKIGALSRAVESWQYNFRPPYIRVIFSRDLKFVFQMLFSSEQSKVITTTFDRTGFQISNVCFRAVESSPYNFRPPWTFGWQNRVVGAFNVPNNSSYIRGFCCWVS